MQKKTVKLGPWLIVVTSLFGYVLLILNQWYYDAFWFDAPMKYGAKFGSYIGTVLFCWNFILATRWKFLQKWFGGLDTIYKAHAWVGVSSALIIILHPLFLSMRSGVSLEGMLRFWQFKPMTSGFLLGYNLGIIAFILLFVLVALTAWKKLPYHVWKWTHRLFHVFLWLVIVHVVLMDKDIAHYPLLTVWFYTWMGLAVASSIYSMFYYLIAPRYQYSIHTIEYFPDSVEVLLKPIGKPLLFLPGQFAFFSFRNPAVSVELHPFSMANAPRKDGYIKLGIKFLGSYTRTLAQLQKGDAVHVFGPFGTFGEKFLYGKRDCLFIGAGIGITPFLSMWDTALNSHEKIDIISSPGNIVFDPQDTTKWQSPNVHLYYLCKSHDEATFCNDIENISIYSQFRGFREFGLRGHDYTLHLSKDQGRITAQRLLDDIPDLTERNIFICGPRPLLNALTKDLLALGVPRSQIISEEFDYKDMATLLHTVRSWFGANG